MIPVLIPTWRADGDWRDLELAVTSLRLYAPEHQVYVGWRGPNPPPLLPSAMVFERPPEAVSSAQAVWWMREQFASDEFVLFSDDAVAGPDTIGTLLADVATLHRTDVGKKGKVGIVGCRSDWVAGAQNIRIPNGEPRLEMCRFVSEDSILRTETVFPVVACYRAELFDGITAFDHEWYSDNAHCRILSERGYRHFVSRAYVHHVGMRSSQAANISAAELDAVGRDAYEASLKVVT